MCTGYKNHQTVLFRLINSIYICCSLVARRSLPTGKKHFLGRFENPSTPFISIIDTAHKLFFTQISYVYI